MVRYREFAPRIEIAEAVATWPLVHKAAVQAGVTGEDEPAPHGDSAVKERMARDRKAMPAAAAQAIREVPLPGTEPAPPLPDNLGERPTGDGPAATRPHPDASRPDRFAEPTRAPSDLPIEEPRRSAAPTAAQRPAHHPTEERGALFGGEYSGRERETQPRQRAADRQDRSLDAVFSRLSGGRDRLPDPRERARTTPGLGAVFGRLR